MQYVYDFAALDHVPDGAVLSGDRIICTLGRQARGTGAKAHSHPSEQFNYVLAGVMMSDIEGDRVFASKGMILHTPGSAVHSGLACPDEDLVFLAIKDARSGVISPHVDGQYDGPNCFAGYGSRSDEPRQTTDDVIEESKRLPPGPGKRYVYDMSNHRKSISGPASAEVTLDAQLKLPPGITGKLLSGEALHVAVLRFESGSTLVNYRRDNEQFVFVVQGELEVELGEQQLEVRRHCMLHIPAGIQHELTAPNEALVVIAQDKRGN